MNRELVKTTRAALAVLLAVALLAGAKRQPKRPPEPSALDRYIAAATAGMGSAGNAPQTPGSVWEPNAPLSNLAGDLRAMRTNDLVTIVVAESASALSSGTVKTQRTSSSSAQVGALGHKYGGASAMANLANLSGATTLDGQGSTGRQTALTTVMSARVAQVLSNGYLVLEGHKVVQVNSEVQTITVRGIVRPSDLGSDNSVQSERLAQMEVTVNGKGVVGDSIRRPMFLYRLLTGLLPF